MPSKRSKSKEREKKKKSRNNETELEKQRRLEDQRIRQNVLRYKEDEGSKQRRLEDKRIRQKVLRYEEDEGSKQKRLEDQRIRQNVFRYKEDDGSKQRRLELDRLKHQQVWKESKNEDKTLFIAASVEEVEPFSVGLMNNLCNGCGALMFAGETHKGKLGKNGEKGTAVFSMCCRYGKIVVPKLKDPPDLLKKLLTEDNGEARKFRANIRSINNLLSFASKGITGKLFEDIPGRRGPPMFKLTGQMYHLLVNMFPEEGKLAAFSQLYVHDSQEDHRLLHNKNPEVDPELLKKLQQMIEENNPMVKLFKQAAQVMKENETQDLALLIKAKSNENSKAEFRNPKSEDVSIIIPNSGGNTLKNPRDVILYKRQSDHPKKNKTVRISEFHPFYDPSAYPLLHVYGDYGFELGLYNRTDGKKMTTLDFYRFRVMVREGEFNTLLRGERLTQEYLTDMWCKIEGEKLNYLETHQRELRTEVLQGLTDALDNQADVSQIGKAVRLPSSYIGGSRYMYSHYQDALSIVRVHGSFSFFVTITCHASHSDILSNIFPGQSAANRPDIMSRVFKLQMKEFLDDLFHKNVLGTAIAWVYNFEQQMRRLWHAHISLKVAENISVDMLDCLITCEIPDPEEDPELYNLVAMFMVHGPCGSFNKSCPCMVENKDKKLACRFGYPKPFNEQTYFVNHGYPVYRRPDDGRTIKKGNFTYTSQWIVPYNPRLLKKYRCHINTEFTGSLGTVKYQLGYTHKGQDLATVSLQGVGKEGEPVNEIQKHLNARYIDPHHATWRMFENELLGRFPAVERLDIHLPNKQAVSFNPEKEEETVQQLKDTKLTAWFKLNSVDEEARQYTYLEIPEHYVWNRKEWTVRKKSSDVTTCIGRIFTILRSQGEIYFLRLLLTTAKGCKSFNDLLTYNMVVHSSFKDVAHAMGLLTDDKEIIYALEETAMYGSPAKLRQTFALMLKHGEINAPDIIWNMFKEESMSDLIYQERRRLGRHLQLDIKKVENESLKLIEDLLQDMDTSLTNISSLPNPEIIHHVPKVIERELFDTEEQKRKFIAMEAKMNHGQREIFEVVKDSLYSSDPTQFCINAAAGSGKTFLFQLLSAFVRMNGGICLCMASTGIAAWNMENGRTAHSRFKLPIPLLDDSVCGVKLQTSEAEVIRQAKLIIWDEVFNINKLCLEITERFLRDLMGNELPWGGKVIVFGGDPRQIPPVVRRGGRAEIVAASVKSSPLYSEVQELKLTKNMRVRVDNKEYCQWLLDIGDGVCVTEEGDTTKVLIPDDMRVESIQELVAKTFPNLQSTSAEELMQAAIFTTVNDDVWELNKICLELLPGEKKVYLSNDTVEDETTAPTELLNSRKPGGFPDHNLELKVGVPVMLLRNLSCGLVNGTRMVVRGLYEKTIECEVMIGTSKGLRVFIPRIPMVDTSGEFPWVMTRVQYPVRVCFAMSFHKGQGQSLSSVGLYINRPIFTHGMLYVGLSRGMDMDQVKVFLADKNKYSDNVVFYEML